MMDGFASGTSRMAKPKSVSLLMPHASLWSSLCWMVRYWHLCQLIVPSGCGIPLMVLYEFGMLLFEGVLLLTKDIPVKYLQSSSLRMGPEWLQSQRIPYAYGRP